MATKNEQIRKLIRQIVREEIQNTLPSLLAEAFTGLIAESLQNAAPKRPARQVNEVSYNSPEEMDEYPTARPRMDRSRFAALMGGEEFVAPSGKTANGRELIVAHSITENGTAIPVSPRDMPDYLIDALTKDYSGVVKAWDKLKK